MQTSRRQFLGQNIKRVALACLGAHAPLVPSIGQEATAGSWQIGCYTRPFDKADWRVAYDAIAEAGYKYAGLISSLGKNWIMIRVDTALEEAQQMGEEARKRGLTLLSVYADFSVAQSLEAGIQGLRRLIDRCAACGCPNLLLGGVNEAGLAATYFQAVSECCDYAASQSVALSMKPHGGQNATGPQCRRAIEKVGRSNFRLWYDPGNIYYYSDGALDPVEDAAAVDGLVVGMSVKDYRPPKDVMVTPGTGRVRFRAVLERLKEGGFRRGPLLVECLEQGDLKKVIGEAKKAREFLEELVR
ncbi:MAG: sugar phosphate isomerase/epimerase family protein [Verrucomicrobiota bacterium]